MRIPLHAVGSCAVVVVVGGKQHCSKNKVLELMLLLQLLGLWYFLTIPKLVSLWHILIKLPLSTFLAKT